MATDILSILTASLQHELNRKALPGDVEIANELRLQLVEYTFYPTLNKMSDELLSFFRFLLPALIAHLDDNDLIAVYEVVSLFVRSPLNHAEIATYRAQMIAKDLEVSR